MQLDDQCRELQNDIERLRRRLETEGLKAVDRMHEVNDELRSLHARIDAVIATHTPQKG